MNYQKFSKNNIYKFNNIDVMESKVEKGIVHLWDLNKEKTYLELKSEYKQEMIKTLHDLFNGFHKEMGKALGVKPYMITCLEFHPQANSLNLFYKISNLLSQYNYSKFSMKNMEKEVEYIKAKGTAIQIKPKFPFNFNTKEGGVVLSAVLHDGCLSEGRFVYTNNLEDLRKKVYMSLKNIIGDFNTKHFKNQIKFPKSIGSIFIDVFGMKEGSKTLTNPGFPKFILNSDDSVLGKVIDQAISDDGWIQTPRGVALSISVDVTNLDIGLREKVKNRKIKRFMPRILLEDKKL